MKNYLFIYLFYVIGLFIFVSCNQEILPESTSEFLYEEEFRIKFTDYQNESLTKSETPIGSVNSEDIIWEQIIQNMEVKIDGQYVSIVEFFEYYNIAETEAKRMVTDKVFIIDYEGSNYITRAAEPTLQEIRDAMLEECEGYITPVDLACKAAVKIAYMYKLYFD